MEFIFWTNEIAGTGQLLDIKSNSSNKYVDIILVTGFLACALTFGALPEAVWDQLV